jgi:two-component system response regulator YesN
VYDFLEWREFMKILIADDEDYTREGLVHSINWSKLDIGEVMQARNGNEALNMSKWFNPDIVLTDIKMPKLDGIQFAKELMQLNPFCKIIFMSGYMEIEYLKSAIKLSVVDYIEKPIDLTVVIGAIKRAVTEINERKRNKTILENRRELQQQKLANLLILKEYDKSVADSLLEETGLSTDQNFICILAYDRFSSGRKDEVIHQIQVFFGGKGFSSLCDYDKGNKYFIIIFYNRSDRYRLSALYQAFLEIYPQMILGIGFEAENIKNIYNSYQTGVLALNLSFYDENSRLFFVDEEILIHRTIEPGIFGEFIKILKEGPLELKDWINRLFEDLCKHKYFRKEQVQTLLASLITEIFHRYPDFSDSYNFIKNQEHINTIVHEFNFLGEIHRFVLEIIERIEEKHRRESKYSRVIKGTIDYIVSHYTNPDLSVGEIADYMNFTATYMNVLFKQEMRVTLKQYLSNYRLEKAKNMLDNNFNKVTDIAEKCGYANANYFAKVFKEMTNMTPLEYRNRKHD